MYPLDKCNFAPSVYSAWWIRYPWRLDDDDEPPTDDLAKMAQLAAIAPGDEGAKKDVEQQLTGVRSGSQVFAAGS